MSLTRVKLTIIIVNWNTKDLLRQCLEYLFHATTHYNKEIIVVDNGSTDGSPDMVKTKFPEVNLISSKKNLGFAVANNIAFKRLKPTSYVLLLNTDTILTRKIIDDLIYFMENNPKVGVVGPALIFPDGRPQPGGGFSPSPTTIFNYFLFLSHLWPTFFKGLFIDHRKLEHLNSLEVDWLAGTCLLVRGEIIDQVGGFDETFFLYVEDLEWCERIKKRGWKIFYLPRIKLIHYHGASARENSTRWIQSLIHYIKEKRGFFHSLLFRMVSFIGFSLRMVGLFAIFFLTKNSDIREKAKKMFVYTKGTLNLS